MTYRGVSLDQRARRCPERRWSLALLCIVVEGGVEANAEWDGEWEDEADKVTPCLLLSAEDWGRQYMVENCWKLA